MKKHLIAAAALAVLLASGTATADPIDGRFGVTGYLGFQIPANGADNVDGLKLETDTSFTGGGGIIYGIGRSVAMEVLVTNATIDIGNFTDTRFEVTNVDVGLQYRFMPQKKLVPYLGAGMTVLFPELVENGAANYDIDTAYAGFVKVGLDYFMNPHIALTAELKQVIGSTVEIREAGVEKGRYNPDGFHTLFGLKYLF